jgi:hypothetical protein
LPGQEYRPSVGLASSTVGRVLRRHHVPPLSAVDPITGLAVRRRHSGIRYERARPGELVHVDVKKLGRVPDGGGWRLLGRDATIAHRHKPVRIGFDFLHVAVDDHTRLAYVEAHDDERDATAAGFLRRACAWFAGHQVRVQRVLTDNAKVYRTAGTGAPCARSWPSGEGSPRSAVHGRTGKPRASTAPCSASSPTPDRGCPTPTGSPLWTAGSPTTTLDAPTPPWVADHRLAD